MFLPWPLAIVSALVRRHRVQDEWSMAASGFVLCDTQIVSPNP